MRRPGLLDGPLGGLPERAGVASDLAHGGQGVARPLRVAGCLIARLLEAPHVALLHAQPTQLTLDVRQPVGVLLHGGQQRLGRGDIGHVDLVEQLLQLTAAAAEAVLLVALLLLATRGVVLRHLVGEDDPADGARRRGMPAPGPRAR